MADSVSPDCTAPSSTAGSSLFEATQAAYARIRANLEITPLTRSIALSSITGRDLSLKWDNKLITGSFKERGAVNFLCHLQETGQHTTVCAASAGNHALGLSYHARRFGMRCVLVMPKNASLVKVQACERNGAEIQLIGDTFDDAYAHARTLCQEKGYTFVPPFDHELIVAGQASVAYELLEQSSDFDSIIVPIGGGGLISGIATVLKQLRPELYILGVQSNWATMHYTHQAGSPAKIMPVTIADGIAVKRLGSITGPIISRLVDKVVSVSEQETATALIQFLEREHVVVEGSAAVTLAALTAGYLPSSYKKPVLLVSGSNIDVNLLARLLGREMSQRDRLLRLRASLPDRPGVLHFLSGIIASEGANILEVTHDRSFAREPGNVEITLVLEVRDAAHKDKIMQLLDSAGIFVTAQ